MFFYNSFDNAKKACVLILLLTQSMVIQAQPANASATAVKSEAQEAAVGSSNTQQRAYFFPRWPEKREVRRERVPPPPPGPYMSSALTGIPDDEPSFSRSKRPEMKFESSSAPIETVNPDTPWPSISKSPHRWEPEDGYNYVKPQAKQQPYPVRPSYYNYGYGRPAMNWPAANTGTMSNGGYRR